MNKADWRKHIKNQLCHFPQAEKIRQSDAVQRELEQMPAFAQAKTVLLFWSLPDEVCTHRLIEKWAETKTILLPVVTGEELHLRKFCSADTMTCGCFNIQEPAVENFTDFDRIDVAIIPALAFDKNGVRLGRGKGFYDRLLLRIKAPKIGICFDFQLLEKLPADAWDVKMDDVITSRFVCAIK
ncbi:MAG: 5-formyltetrahydrofolate cyclo-ligase [Prevotellaceae bacterium]|jgi:5-formyltetrahydrofolate cyclo-ligase|nr:5-formyltetrahydrofolate cyclo-ligase [Prevotellaceae bacterium]